MVSITNTKCEYWWFYLATAFNTLRSSIAGIDVRTRASYASSAEGLVDKEYLESITTAAKGLCE